MIQLLWYLGAAAVGALGATAWTYRDEIKEWLDSTIDSLLEKVDDTIETISRVTVSLIRKTGSIYKNVRLFVRSKTGINHPRIEEEIVPCNTVEGIDNSAWVNNEIVILDQSF